MSEEIAVCGLRYGKTKYQAEQLKKYIEENNLKKVNIIILDSESKQKIDKLRKYIEHEYFKRNQIGIGDKTFQYFEIKKILQILNEGDESNEGN